MADFLARSEYETEFARRLGRLSNRHRQELESYLGNPPDPANVPQEFWDKVQRETEEEFMLLMLLIFAASAMQHGLPEDAARRQADQWAQGQAPQLAADYVVNSRDMLERGAAALNAGQSNGQVGELKSRGPVPRSAVTELTISIFGPARVENIAISETTDAATAGGEAAIAQTVGQSPEDLWITEDDGKVCKICRPLHRQPRRVWAVQFPNGPKAHPRCRCWIKYANQAQPAGAATP
jgi:hypothetical protein